MLSASSIPHQETLFVKKLSEYAQLPQRGSKGAAGYDLFRYLNTYFCSGISIHTWFPYKMHICERKATILALVFLGTGIIKVFSFNELLTMCTLPR